MIKFSNTYEKLPEQFFEKILPEKFKNPKLISFNKQLATDLEIDYQSISDDEIAKIFSGQNVLPGSNPLAMAYAGFQFGHPVPQLGDGRAHLLGETNGYDIQLKGSGRTRFSRGGDGKSALGPVLREYILSEAMNALGVPTTRALCAVTTGEEVLRQDGPEPGGIFTRVAQSHIRVGTFQYFAFQNDQESIKTLLDYTIKRHYPQLENLENYKDKSIGLLKALTVKQSDLIAKWSSLGFIHGVMNTDNFSLAGITIDYGPCAFMDEFKYEKVFSSIDRNGRYSFFNQVPIAKWNILRLAECFLPLIHENQDKAVESIEKEVLPLFDQFEEKRFKAFSKKIGIEDYKEKDSDLVTLFLDYLEKESLDFTQAFRNLPQLYLGKTSYYPNTRELGVFTSQWRKRISSAQHLNEINPIYIPRNHQVQKVIDDAYQGNFETFHKLLEVLSKPFKADDHFKSFENGPEPHERVYQTFCGT
ncbi:MAG: hypothetical protein CME61_02410 [Halobacteriovoraceae bacterium]|nr:hypothetical protein [Halobacteriovoraceae bacterium]